jgi:predicted Fe-Mo cluster-binding NifX family protein
MLIWIPVEEEKGIDSQIVSQADAKRWALVDFDAGEIQSIRFYANREESEEAWVDFIILANKFENYLEYMNEGMMVLVVREEETIEDIIEAFKFKELDEIGL